MSDQRGRRASEPKRTSGKLESAIAALTALAMLSPFATAEAVERHGWYFGLEGGLVKVNDNDSFFGETVKYENGRAGLVEVGYAFNGHWRVELEGGMRRNAIDKIGGSSTSIGDLRNYTGFLNAIWDAPISSKWSLSLGAGVGIDHVYQDFFGLHQKDTVFAAQGIAGLAYHMSQHWDLDLNYRYLWAADPNVGLRRCGIEDDFSVAVVVHGSPCDDSTDVRKHTITIGFRYGFDEPPPPPAPAPAMAPPPPPKHFVIFFGFNKCNITAEADSVLQEAAAAAKSTGAASVTIVGHTDTVGSAKYNQKLSECRANATKANLVGKGFPEATISASGRGESELMVQTGDGVKEPQNRRATIDLN